MKLILTRHGQSEGNKENLISGGKDFKLTEKGIDQARTLGQYLREKNIYIDLFYAGSLSRSEDTVKYIMAELWVILSEYRPIMSINNSKISERSFGCFEGKTKEKIAEQFATDSKNIHHHLVSLPDSEKEHYGIETNKDIYARASLVLYDLLHNRFCQGKTILLVGHGGFNRALYYVLHGLGEDAFNHEIDKNLRFDHCSYSEIDIVDHTAKDIVINQKLV